MLTPSFKLQATSYKLEDERNVNSFSCPKYRAPDQLRVDEPKVVACGLEPGAFTS